MRNLLMKLKSSNQIFCFTTGLSVILLVFIFILAAQVITGCSGKMTAKASFGSSASGGTEAGEGDEVIKKLKEGCTVVQNEGQIDVDGIGDTDLNALADGYKKAIETTLKCLVCTEDYEKNKAVIARTFWKEGTISEGTNYAKKWTKSDGRDRIEDEKTDDGKIKRIMHLTMDLELIKKTLDENSIPYNDDCAYDITIVKKETPKETDTANIPPRPEYTFEQVKAPCKVISDGTIFVFGIGDSDMEALADGYIKAIKRTLRCYLCDQFDANYNDLAARFWKEGVLSEKSIYAKKWTTADGRDRIRNEKTRDGKFKRIMDLKMDLDLIYKELYLMGLALNAPCSDMSKFNEGNLNDDGSLKPNDNSDINTKKDNGLGNKRDSTTKIQGKI